MTTRRAWTTSQYVDGIRAGDRRSLARAITLIESVHPDDAKQADEVLDAVLPGTGSGFRVGITGVPGVGKSTFIEALGSRLVDRGQRLAVLAIDPSSAASGGSILGDKTRMAELSKHDRAFIRPSPAAGTLGGVARRTREAVLLCEAAGFDIVFVETIGVGQSEVAVADMVDFFLLLMLAGAGDDLQGIKRGIMEMADLVVITKADGDNLGPARRAAIEYERALHILRGDGIRALTCSTRTGDGIDACWSEIEEHRAAAAADGLLAARRHAQDLVWFDRTVEELALARFHADPDARKSLAAQRALVADGKAHPSVAARRVRYGYGD